jgi:hypothetical protein
MPKWECAAEFGSSQAAHYYPEPGRMRHIHRFFDRVSSTRY